MENGDVHTRPNTFWSRFKSSFFTEFIRKTCITKLHDTIIFFWMHPKKWVNKDSNKSIDKDKEWCERREGEGEKERWRWRNMCGKSDLELVRTTTNFIVMK